MSVCRRTQKDHTWLEYLFRPVFPGFFDIVWSTAGEGAKMFVADDIVADDIVADDVVVVLLPLLVG